MATLWQLLLDWLRLVRSARARPYLLITLFVDASLAFVFLVAIQSYLPEQYATSAALPGYALAAYGGAKLAGQLVGGRLIDRLGAGRGLLLGIGLIAAGQAALMSAAVTPYAALPAAAIYGLGGAVVWPAIYVLAAAEFPAEERARLTSGMTLTTGMALALGLGLGFVLPTSFPYTAATALSLIAAVPAAIGARRFASIRPQAAEAPAARVSAGQIVRAVLNPQRLGFSLVVLLQTVTLGALLAVFRSYGRDVIGVSFREELLLLVPAGVVGAGAVVVGGALSDRVGRIPLIGTGFLIASLSVWSLSTVSAPIPVLALAALVALGLGLAMPSTGAMQLDLSRAAGAGTLLGWFLTMEGLGHAIGPAAGAWLSGTAGTTPVLWLAGGLFAAISVIALVPPIWGNLSFDAVGAARRTNVLLSGALKGGLVVGLVLPVISTYWAWTPSSQVYGHIITHGPRDRMTVALTFDDGPSNPWTLRIADTLDAYGVQGTFFVVGMNADRHPEIVKELVDRGHLVGNHSYKHQKSDAVLQLKYGELGKAERAIAQAAGVCPALFRPPNGFHTPWQLRAVSHHHMKTVDWDVIPRDWKDPPPEEIVSRVLDSVKPGSIILLHDGDNTNDGTDRSATLAALPGIINGLRERGYEFARLDELLSVDPYLPSCDGMKDGA